MTDTDLDVREALDRLAAEAGPPRGADAADAAVTLARRQRRTRAAWAAGALAVALLGAAAPAVLPDAGPVPGETAGGQHTQQAAPALPDLPTRGSLAGDEDFVAGVAAIDWSGPLGRDGAVLRPPESSRHVAFAGELPDGRRWALVTGEDEGQLLHAWFGGPAGAAPDELALIAPPERSGRGATVAVLDTTGAQPVLVVVTRPFDGARYSPGTVRLGDGSIGRVWTELPGDDGVLVAEVPAPVHPGSEVVDLLRDGSRTSLRYVSRTAGTPVPVAWSIASTADPSLTADPAVEQRFVGCLLPQGFVVRFGADGALTVVYPTPAARRSDVELVHARAGWDAVVDDCAARALAGG
ncbi:hypothetical protein SAMN04488107_3773 [Geodermatophilus saharensis]|uniref:Uncharacterized protein n=1 Tax=Geodermatophilus saharensis TaxID=1137994 RepID=A0A239HA85_9ACTN|nr:hypothetical protein [Geodermatophilus saharensis]SNS78356.1 hypothetical protein SAMN04488107_3773 [Geodermatophilus saharensis]